MTRRSRRALRSVRPPTDPAEQRARFDDLYRREWSGIVALGWSLTGSWVSAEELAQDAFADAYRRWDEVGHLDKPGAWVRRAVINRSASYHRSRAAEQRGLERWSGRSDADRDGPDVDRTGDRATDQVGDPAFWAAVRSLPVRQVECVALHYLEDRSVADIAQVLGCRPATVKVHLHRGRLALAEHLRSSRSDAGDPTPAPTPSYQPPRPASSELTDDGSTGRTRPGGRGAFAGGRRPAPGDPPWTGSGRLTQPATGPSGSNPTTVSRSTDDRPLDDRGEEAR